MRSRKKYKKIFITQFFITTDNAILGISQKPSFMSKFHLTGRDRLHINEKGIETAREHAFDL